MVKLPGVNEGNFSFEAEFWTVDGYAIGEFFEFGEDGGL